MPGCVYYIHFIYKPVFKTVFSPFQSQPILESGAVELLCGLTQSENPALRVNGIWALMVCFTKRRKQLLKLKLKNVLFGVSEIFFFKILTLLAQFYEDLGPKRFHSPFRFEYKQVSWPLCSLVLLFIKKSRIWGKKFSSS